MKRLRFPLGLLACLLVSAAVPLAYGSAAAKDPRVPGLIARVGKLESDVKTLKVVAAGVLSCLDKVAPVKVYGNPTQNEGYMYRKASDPTNLYLTSALDFAAQGDQPDGIVQLVEPSCIHQGMRATFLPGLKHQAVILRSSLSLAH
jgi:hypothetical protein